MIDLKILAKNCNNCLDWNRICNANCCRTFTLNKTDTEETEDQLILTNKQTKDMYFYLSVHGGRIEGDSVIFTKKDYVITRNPFQIVFNRKCNYLDEDTLKCIHHEDGKRPKVCKDFDETTGVGPGSYAVPLCLAHYKKRIT